MCSFLHQFMSTAGKAGHHSSERNCFGDGESCEEEDHQGSALGGIMSTVHVVIKLGNLAPERCIQPYPEAAVHGSKLKASKSPSPSSPYATPTKRITGKQSLTPEDPGLA